jgi:hypothetical protein
VRGGHRRAISGVLRIGALWPRNLCVATVTIGATEDHGGIDVHRVVIARRVAALASFRFCIRDRERLALRCRWARDIRTHDRRFTLGGGSRHGDERNAHRNRKQGSRNLNMHVEIVPSRSHDQ